MKDTKDMILNASIEVFSEKGYTLTTTLEISKKAGVSEMTLFRHFQTKNNLFLSAIKQSVGESFKNDITIDSGKPLKMFVADILHEKLLSISTHHALIKMLIRETLANQLPSELAFTKMIYMQITDKLETYIKDNQLSLDAKALADLMVGMLLKYAVMSDLSYHTLTKNKQKDYLNPYQTVEKVLFIEKGTFFCLRFKSYPQSCENIPINLIKASSIL